MSDWTSALLWWLLVEFFGLLALPLTFRLFRRLPDHGYGVSKALGLLLVGYVLWLLGVLGFVRNDTGGLFLAMAFVVAISLALYFRRSRNDDQSSDLVSWLKRNWRLVLAVELVFAAAFAAWALYRANVPCIETSGGEKFMELAFLNAIKRSDSLPPLDPWLSGYAISYYYFGYVIVSMLIRLSQVPASVGFNLGGALLFALTAIGAFSLVYNLAASAQSERDVEADLSRWPAAAWTAALLGAVFVVLLSNLQAPLEVLHWKSVGSEGFWRWVDIPEIDRPPPAEPGKDWTPGRYRWWWRASRVVSDYDLRDWQHWSDPDAQPPPHQRDNIDEFPFFSFLLGDMHPHVLALPFVMLSLTGALALFGAGRARRFRPGQTEGPEAQFTAVQGGWGDWLYRSWGQVQDDLGLTGWELFFFALMLGALGFLNSWDLPIHWLVAVGAFALGRLKRQSQAGAQIGLGRLLSFRPVLFLGLFLGFASLALYLPFFVGFQSQASGLLPHVHSSTRLTHLGVMFGPFLFIFCCFLAWQMVRTHKQGGLALAWGLKVGGLILLAALTFLLLIALALWLFPAQSKLLGHNNLRALVAPGLEHKSGGWLALNFLWMRLSVPWVTLLLTAMLSAVAALLRSPVPRPATRFALLLVGAGALMVLVPEYVYIRDIFGVRLNSVFKFYYQAWVMWAIAAAFAVYALLLSDERPQAVFSGAFGLGLVFVVFLGLVYPTLAIPTRAKEFAGPSTLDGTAHFAVSHAADYAAITWLNENVAGAPVILETSAQGAYQYEGRVSVMTGLPTLLGWGTHEQQWRGSYDLPGQRLKIIRELYTTYDPKRILTLLDEYDITYVYVGPLERQTYSLGEKNLFDQLMDVVYQQNGVTIYKTKGK